MKILTFARNTKIVLRTTAFLLTLLSTTLLPILMNPPAALAGTDTYPTSIGGCRAVSGSPSGTFTCDLKNSTQDIYFDPWSEENRECVSYVAWMLSSVNGFTMPFFGNATDWKTKAKGLGYTVDMTPKQGSVYWQQGTATNPAGHVAYVESVSTDGTHVTTMDYNQANTGVWAEHPNILASSADGYIHFKDISSPPPPPTNPLHISAIHTGGGAEAKEGSLSAGWWALSSNGATQVMEDGTLNGLVYNGELLVNQGHPTNNWIVEDASGSVVSASITDAVGSTPARIGLLRNDGTFWIRDGLNGAWIQQSGSVAAGYVSGNRVAVLLTNGQFWVKDGMYSSSWVLEQGSVSDAALSGDASTNGLIGVILTDGTYEVKQGDLGAGWVVEQGAAAKTQLSNATSQTPVRIGYIDTAGNYWVKEGISGGWVLEQGGVINAALSGNLIGVVMSDGTYEVKQGGLGAGWVTEDGLITQNALWSQY